MHETVDKGHGRLEIRRLWASTELNGYLEFPHHQQVMRIERITETLKTGKIRHEIVYGVTSLTPEKASTKWRTLVHREFAPSCQRHNLRPRPFANPHQDGTPNHGYFEKYSD